MPDNRKPLIYGAFPVCRNYTVRAHLRNDGPTKRCGHQNRQQYAGSLLRRLHAGHLRPRHHRRAAQSGADDGEHPIPCRLMLSATRSRWGQRLGQKKAAHKKRNLRKEKDLEIRRFRGLLVRREGFEPPAVWSVGCLKGKSELFRLRFVLFATVRSADLPLFPSSPARSNSILGQNWVRNGAPAPTPTAPRSPSRRRQQQDRPRRPHHSCSPTEYR